MSEFTDKKKRFVKAYNKFVSIEDEKDLRKNKLTLAEYQILYDVLEKLSKFNDCTEVYCFYKSIADWCKNVGFSVTPPNGDENDNLGCINYLIKI